MKDQISSTFWKYRHGINDSGKPLTYIDTRELYNIKLPKEVDIFPNFRTSQELVLNIGPVSQKEATIIILNTLLPKTNENLGLSSTVFLQKTMMQTDPSNFNITTQEYSHPKYPSSVISFDRQVLGEGLVKGQNIFVEVGGYIFEFVCMSPERKFKDMASVAQELIESLVFLERNCEDVTPIKTGVFKPSNSKFGQIVRNENIQTEYVNEAKDKYIKSSMDWVDKCTLHLTFIEDFPKGFSSYQKGDVEKVTILNIEDDWYDCIWETGKAKNYQKCHIIKE